MIERKIKMILGKVSLMVLLISFPALSYSQAVEPPMSTDDFSWMRWLIIILVGVIATLFTILRTMYNDRIGDKDSQIVSLNNQISNLESNIISLQSDKDQMQKDLIEKVIPALTSSTDVLRSIINNQKI